MKDYPAASFTVEMAFYVNCWSYSTSVCLGGLVIRDSISMKLTTFGLGGSYGDVQVQVYNWNSPTSSSGNATNWPLATWATRR